MSGESGVPRLTLRRTSVFSKLEARTPVESGYWPNRTLSHEEMLKTMPFVDFITGSFYVISFWLVFVFVVIENLVLSYKSKWKQFHLHWSIQWRPTKSRIISVWLAFTFLRTNYTLSCLLLTSKIPANDHSLFSREDPNSFSKGIFRWR